LTKNHPTLLLIKNDALLKHLTLSKKEQSLIDLFWLGFLIYTIAYSISQSDYANWALCQAVQCLGIALLIPGTISQLWFKFENLYLKFMFSIYFIWLMTVMVRGMKMDYVVIKWLLFDAWFGGFLYFVPLMVLFPRNLFFYKRLFDVIIILGIVFLGLNFMFAREIIFADRDDLTSRGIVETFTRTLAMPTTFILLTYMYHSKKRKILSAAIVGIIALSAIFKARRGLLLMTSLPLIITYIFYLMQSKSKLMVIVFTMAFCSIVLVYGLSVYQESSLFGYMRDRGLEDTRSTVEVCLFADMTTLDWIIGKGLTGEYYCPSIDPNEDSDYRSVIETDYLHLILKGGIVSVVLLLLIMIPAAYLGLFASKNMLSKAAGAWITLAMINMYPSTVFTFTINYIIVWVSIGICYSKTIRSLPDEVLKLYFNPV